MKISELLQPGQLPDSETERLDLELLLGYVLERDRAYLYTWPEKVVESEDLKQFQELVSRRRAGVPLAHLVGTKEFWSLKLFVSSKTLIPRPDTETLVQAVLDRHGGMNGSILDLGTGTGAIALALAHSLPAASVVGVDLTEEIVQLAADNARANGILNCHFLASDWFDQLDGEQFSLIVSNPPYIPESDPHLQLGDVRFEPRTALVSGSDGLNDIRRIIEKSRVHLSPKGWLFLEHGYDQAESVRRLFENNAYCSLETLKDYGGNERVTFGRKRD